MAKKNKLAILGIGIALAASTAIDMVSRFYVHDVVNKLMKEKTND